MSFVDWREMSSGNCPVGRGLDLLGKPWALLVVRDLMLGIRRFEDLHAKLGASRPVLAARLRELEAAGVVLRVPYQDAGQRSRHEYRLTDRGRDLYPVIMAVREWGERHLLGGEGVPIISVHRGCGARVETSLGCSAGHTGLGIRDTEAIAGPGARRRTA